LLTNNNLFIKGYEALYCCKALNVNEALH